MRSLTALILFFCTLFSQAQKNQNEILSGFESGKYTVFKVEKISYGNYKMVKVKKQWPLQINKSGNTTSSVLVKRAGILDELFKPDVPGHPAYFNFKEYRLTFTDDIAIYYTWSGKEKATTKYVFSKGSSLSKNFEELNKSVEKYARAVFKNQTGARAEVKKQKAAIAEAERRENSLQDRQVRKIEVKLINRPSKVAHFSEAIKYGIVATLKDGSILKTKNLGGKIPWSDFVFKNKGCSKTKEVTMVDEDATSFTEDRIEIIVVSKYHPTLKAVKYLNTTNDIPVIVNQGGFWGHERHNYVAVIQGRDGQHGGRGDNLTIRVKTVKHKQTGERINKIDIYNTTKKSQVARFKLKPNVAITINNPGGGGMKGYDGNKSYPNGGNGGSGGNGGNILLIKDPSVTQLNITLNNAGGQAGQGGSPKYSYSRRGNNGRRGARGNTTKRVSPVKLKF